MMNSFVLSAGMLAAAVFLGACASTEVPSDAYSGVVSTDATGTSAETVRPIKQSVERAY